MLCDKCGQKTATTHIKTSINGIIEVHHLCADCAKEHSGGSSVMLDSLIGSFFGDSLKSHPVTDNRRRCEGCGMCFDDIAQSGKVGCDKCYETFLEQLLPSLQRMHGRSRHAGKVPNCIKAEHTVEDKIADLSAQMQRAVEAQDFELAAKLRDEIKELKKEDADNE